MLARFYCGNHADAEDLSQDVWLKAYRFVGTIRDESNFYGWLRQILVHTFLNWKRELPCVPDDEIQGWHASTSDDHDGRMLLAGLTKALGELPTSQRLMMLMKYQEGLTQDEIAKLLGCSAGTVKKGLYRAINKLRSTMDPVREADRSNVG